MNNMNGYGNGFPGGFFQGGYTYHEQPKLNMTQGLTKDQLNALKKTGGFDLNISEEDLLRSYCTHRYDDRFTVSIDDEGNMICALCGTKFKPFEGNTADARELVERVIDLAETTKMQSITLPPQVIKDFFQIEPMLKKLPELFNLSQNDRNRALPRNDAYMYGQDGNAFATYTNIINPLAGNGYCDPAMMNYNQPVYGSQAPMNQPMMPQGGYGYQQPMMQQGQVPMNQPMGQPMMPQGGYGYQQPMMQQGMPQNNPFNSAPVNNAQPAQSAPAPTQDQVTVNKTLTD